MRDVDGILKVGISSLILFDEKKIGDEECDWKSGFYSRAAPPFDDVYSRCVDASDTSQKPFPIHNTPFFTYLWDIMLAPILRLVRTDIVALGENSMSVQYPGCRAAILGVIHHHCSDTSFNFTPEIYSRIESQRRFCLVCATHDSNQ